MLWNTKFPQAFNFRKFREWTEYAKIKCHKKFTSPVWLQQLVNSNGNAKNREIKMQQNFASPKRQNLNSAKIVCLTSYKPITLNSKLSTVSLF